MRRQRRNISACRAVRRQRISPSCWPVSPSRTRHADGRCSRHSFGLEQRFGQSHRSACEGYHRISRTVQHAGSTVLLTALGVSRRAIRYWAFPSKGARARIESASLGAACRGGTAPTRHDLCRPHGTPSRIAIWQNQGKFQLIDRSGEVVADEDVATFTDLPLVVGLGAPEPMPSEMLDGARLPCRTSSHAWSAIVRVGERRWNLQLKNRLTVMLPEGHEAVPHWRGLNRFAGASAIVGPANCSCPSICGCRTGIAVQDPSARRYGRQNRRLCNGNDAKPS